MEFNWNKVLDIGKAIISALTFRRDNSPISSSKDVERFVATRAAYIAQRSLYGYLKTRIGTRYPRVFDDKLFVRSIDIAKFHVFDACLSDLAIYAAALALKDRPLSDDHRAALAMRCFRGGLEDNLGQAPEEFNFGSSLKAFADRLEVTDWAVGALHRDNFSRSPSALIKWAPIADRFKDEDEEIVRNSIKFAWRDIREQFQKRLVSDQVFEDCKGRPGDDNPPLSDDLQAPDPLADRE